MRIAALMLAESISAAHDDDQTDKLNEAKQFIQQRQTQSSIQVESHSLSHGCMCVFAYGVLRLYRESVAASLDTQNDM